MFRMTLSDEEEERNANYERYRILVQNECAGGKYLNPIYSHNNN